VPCDKTDDLALYEDLVFFVLYRRFRDEFDEMIRRVPKRAARPFARCWPKFSEQFKEFGEFRSHKLPLGYGAAHPFAVLFQIRRAFHHIFWYIVGDSEAMMQLRGRVWRAIFTHDISNRSRMVRANS
jgi:hypothetical protein